MGQYLLTKQRKKEKPEAEDTAEPDRLWQQWLLSACRVYSSGS